MYVKTNNITSIPACPCTVMGGFGANLEQSVGESWGTAWTGRQSITG